LKYSFAARIEAASPQRSGGTCLPAGRYSGKPELLPKTKKPPFNSKGGFLFIL